MREELYITDKNAILNYSAAFYQNAEELLNGEGFRLFMENYLKNLAIRDIKVFSWLTKGRSMEDMIPELILVTKQLLVLDVDEIYSTLLFSPNRLKALYIVEDAYNYWRRKERFAIVNSTSSNSLAFNSFIDADTRYNWIILQIYRTCEEKLQGRKNRIYRQLQAGTNACAVLQTYRWKTFPGYGVLKSIPFITTVMLRTPILLHTVSNKREGFFEEVDYNPIRNCSVNQKDWLCYPIKVGRMLCYVYFHRDFISSAISLSNLFEIATEEECLKNQPDLIVLFGNRDHKDACVFNYDSENDVWVGSVSYSSKIEYFGYLKKMILTLHNVRAMQHGSLPLHGSMIDIFFKNNQRKTMIMIGDSGAGKSETIEAIKTLNQDIIGDLKISRMDVVFDDMGSMYIEQDGHVYASGTEIGAFVRLDDLAKGTAYRDMERTIFFNPESSVNARLVSSISSYEMVSSHHPIDMVLYANNYDDKVGVHRFATYKEAKKVFIEGKRMAMGTTQENGLSSTFFANPFGPMQQPKICERIMDDVFAQLYRDDVYVGEIYTNLGSGHKDKLAESSRQLLEILHNL
ncbi:MAG: phosphoenolpyruvate carboxykinase (ATP) [Erysipelotrichaceae bacterium]|nr:phosphoenolpyruvate carboxykinase (ATP) [Erysipelotrichaceae bacterium]